jgi:N-acetylglucosamine-6-phosphate deacetylase
MMLLSGADLVLRDQVLPGASLLIEGGRITAIEARAIDGPTGTTRLDVSGRIVVPGFIDVHVHGVEGVDTLDGGGAIAAIAARLPRYGVTSFCPTSVACEPAALSRMLTEVRAGRRAADGHGARVLPAHLESNFINAEYRGAQPLPCLRTPAGAAVAAASGDAFTAGDVLDVIQRDRDAVGIVTVAPELEGGLELIRALRAAGHIVSVGHSGATFEQTRAAIEAGVTHATHLFNRMPPLHHRAPGVVGAVLGSEAVRAELICDGVHVHPALMALAIRTKGASGVMAITDGTAGAGLPTGSRARLGGRPIRVTARSAELDDGTLAGSILTMDQAFRMLVGTLGLSLVEAAALCATTPADQLGRADLGRIQVGAVSDLVVLDRSLAVEMTLLAGERWRNPSQRLSV